MFTRIIIVFMMCLASAGQVAALELVYPADGTFVTKSNYVIIKAGEQTAIDGITININDVGSDLIDISSPEYKQVFADMLILMPDLDPGANNIVVRGFAGQQEVAAVKADVYYAPNIWDDVPQKYQPYLMHVPAIEKLCAQCHNMAPSSAEINSLDPRVNPCNSCHKRMLTEKHVHGPAGVLECVACHSETAGQQKYTLAGDGNDACLECHEDMMDEFRQQKFMHGPVELGQCLLCHDPHASDETAQVRVKVNDLCQQCHAEVVSGKHVLRGVTGEQHPVKDVYDPMKPQRELTCASCHDPHGGAGPQYFVNGIANRFDLCQYCHKK